MTRTFSTLAVLLIFAILATIAVGFWSFFLPKSDPAKQDIFLVHFHLGLWTTIGILLVHCIIFTYFLGTGRWVKEVTLAYRMPDEPLHKTTRKLKRATFPPAFFHADCNFYFRRWHGRPVPGLALVHSRRRGRPHLAH